MAHYIAVEQQDMSTPLLTPTDFQALTVTAVTQGMVHAGEEGGAGIMGVEEELGQVGGGAQAMPYYPFV